MGPFGVGKTTALRAISDTDVVKMDVASAEVDQLDSAEGKTTTTVGFDYGEWRFGEEVIELYGLPGQERFSLLWDKFLPETSGVVLWLYGDKPDGIDEARRWLDILKSRDAIARLCVALTRVDSMNNALMIEYRNLVVKYHPFAPIITADPREKSHVLKAVSMALMTPFHLGG